MGSKSIQVGQQLFLSLGALSLIAILGLALQPSLVSPVVAQTDFNIKSKSSDLEKQYRQELDKWMLRAYEGDRDAQFKVGVLFTNNQFGEPDYEQAVYWYRQAARQGHVLAQYNLGHQYLVGVGVKKNDREAMQWWLQAAEQDHSLAQFNVGRAYYLGIGLPEDHEKSKYWFNRAASNQEPKSIEILQQLGWTDTGVVDDAPALAAHATATDPAPEVEPADSSSTESSSAQTTQPAPSPSNGNLVSVIVPAGTESEAETVSSDTASEAEPKDEPDQAAAGSAEPTSSPVAQQATPDTSQAANAADAANTDAEVEAQQSLPTAIYTNPKVRSVLIALIDDRSSLELVERDSNWVTVTSSVGFPVWVHGDFVSATNDMGTITGSAVNARSVPIITNGTVVGRLQKNEVVNILDKRKEWYRVVAPQRFKAFVKVADFDRTNEATASGGDDNGDTVDDQLTAQSSTATDVTPEPQQPRKKLAGPRPINDNEWLYSQPSDSFTLQLASFDDPSKIKEFVSRARFADNPELHQFTSRSNDITWTYFLYGSYADRASAESAKLRIGQRRAWVRSFELLQQNRCVAWKKQLPTPPELNKYCSS
ncbi:MAG: hypothetical protein HKN50_08085 [Gammaproteobacteria bacterium]|nr:hypothetical protein [Gammaproteobacteria bacterium]